MADCPGRRSHGLLGTRTRCPSPFPTVLASPPGTLFLLHARLVPDRPRRGHDLPVMPDEWESFDFAQVRRAVHATKITTQMAADAYLAALASPDPGQNQRPTAAAAEKLGASRGHISRLLSQARREGIEGLGPQRPPRRKEGQD